MRKFTETDMELNVSSHVLRCKTDEGIMVGVHKNKIKDKEIIDGFMDMLHLHHFKYNDFGMPEFVLSTKHGKEKPSENDKALDAIGTLIRVIRKNRPDFRVKISIEGRTVSEEEIKIDPGTIDIPRCEDWCDTIKRRPVDLPEPAKKISKLVDDETLEWNQPVSAIKNNSIDGRISGLKVCELKYKIRNKPEWNLKFILPKGKGKKEILDILAGFGKGAQLKFQKEELEIAAKIIKELASKRKGQADRNMALYSAGGGEHRIESKLIKNKIPNTDIALCPLWDKLPFQFPAIWHRYKDVRHIDYLMRQDEVPWVIEIKDKVSQGEYYRHAIGQVVLYREFLLNATVFRSYFEGMKIDLSKCKAAIVVPELTGDNVEKLESHIEYLRDLFEVEVFQLPPSF